MKKIISLVLVLTICLAFAACTVEPEGETLASAADTIKVKHSDLNQEGYDKFIEKLDAFAAKLTYEIYAGNKQSNICISPVSVYMALALATECSNGETREEILNAVGVTYDEVKNFTKLLYAFSNREYSYTDKMHNKNILAFEELANSIWASKNITLKEEGINNLANDYNCDLFKVNFKNGEGEKLISDYIKEKTHGIIDSDIKLSSDTLITLINTFYLKEIWNDDGDEELKLTDKEYNFKNADGSVANTKLLQGYYFNGKAYEVEGYTSFYTRTEHNFDIKFIVPTDGHTLEEVFTADNIYNINNLGDYGYKDEENKLKHHTRVLFPKYKASFDGDLAKILQNDFGIHDLFDIGQCDFSNVTDTPIFCNKVIHKCGIDVNDKGIEGAAVTVIAMEYGAADFPDNYKKVYHDYIVDRAFGFVITDSYGVVLFSGVVNSVN